VIGLVLHRSSIAVMPSVRTTASGRHAQVLTGVLELMLAGIAWGDSRAIDVPTGNPSAAGRDEIVQLQRRLIDELGVGTTTGSRDGCTAALVCRRSPKRCVTRWS
jgi:hypothetical protein